MTHITEIKELTDEPRTFYRVVCSCGFTDPKEERLMLITRGDAEASERDHRRKNERPDRL